LPPSFDSRAERISGVLNWGSGSSAGDHSVGGVVFAAGVVSAAAAGSGMSPVAAGSRPRSRQTAQFFFWPPGGGSLQESVFFRPATTPASRAKRRRPHGRVRRSVIPGRGRSHPGPFRLARRGPAPRPRQPIFPFFANSGRAWVTGVCRGRRQTKTIFAIFCRETKIEGLAAASDLGPARIAAFR